MNAAHKQRWYQFSLRTLLLVMTALCILPGSYVAYQEYKARRQQAAIRSLEQLGGTFVPDRHAPRGLDLGATGIENEALSQLADIPDLQRLSLAFTPVTDEGMQSLKNLRDLRELYLDNTDVTDEGLKSLESLSNLETLSLVGTHITDEGLQHIQGLSQLKQLHLGGTKVTGAGVIKLRKALPRTTIFG